MRFPSSAAAEAVGSAVVEWEAVATRGYARSCAHWRARLADDRRVFIKQALNGTAVEWLRAERVIYEAVRGSFMPSFYGAYDDGELALIALEDLTDAEWPPPWSPSRIERVLASLDALHRTAPPNEIEKLEAIRGEVVGWSDIAANPEPMLSTGLCAPAWLEEALPALLQASEDAQLDGTELLHFDVRSDNLCLRGENALFFDWNLARIGNGDFDVAFWLPSLTLEGGPAPSEVLPAAGPLAAAVAGFFAVRAGLPPRTQLQPYATSSVRKRRSLWRGLPASSTCRCRKPSDLRPWRSAGRSGDVPPLLLPAIALTDCSLAAHNPFEAGSSAASLRCWMR